LGLVVGSRDRDIVICPSFVNLSEAVEAVRGTGIGIGGQNVYWASEGAYTGEISGQMLKAVGADWVIIGHSERRQYFGETDETVLKRTVAALEAGLRPIVCLGECLEDRESGRTETVCATQFEGGISELTPEQFSQIAIAYEPVWAIGTGRTATPEIAQDAHKFLRSLIGARFGSAAADLARILYGGSVKPENAKALMSEADIDGALVGGASLDPKSFAAIVNF
ncbi:MAG: triose-phosphate isomerase, partial [Bryobacteraceae bacterium]|nr:triose-phosphate isomerase [Bryobacteraceae bacterium]